MSVCGCESVYVDVSECESVCVWGGGGGGLHSVSTHPINSVVTVIVYLVEKT